MFRKFAVCTAVFVAARSNDALALQQSRSLLASTAANQDKAYPSTPSVPAPLSTGTPIADLSLPSPIIAPSTTPTTVKGIHATDCDPHFPAEPLKSSSLPPSPLTTVPAATTPTPLESALPPPSPPSPEAAPPPASAPGPGITPAPTTPTIPEAPVSPAPAIVEAAALNASPASIADGSGNNNAEEPTQQANTQSSEKSSTNGSSFMGVGVLALVGAVAAVGTIASRMKKAQEDDADAALATPGDSRIHIEIRHTPTGGSTIL